ncbi:hypothetical protein LINGRAPRIM_LOCUS2200 [Linum grandiflorum]
METPSSLHSEPTPLTL